MRMFRTILYREQPTIRNNGDKMGKKCYIGDIQRFCTEDGPGIRTTVFFKGCPLRCMWCHNPELLSPSFYLHYDSSKCILCGRCIKVCEAKVFSVKNNRLSIDRSRCGACLKCTDACCSGALYIKSHLYTIEELEEEVLRDKNFFRNSGGGVTFSGGEILSSSEYVIAAAEMIKENDLSLAIETSGYGEYEDLYRLAELSDCILYDLKHMDSERHRFYTGVTTAVIHENLEKLAGIPDIRDKIIIRTPVIHGVNDDERNIELMSEYLAENKIGIAHLLPYHKLGIKKAREMGIEQEEFSAPSKEVLLRIKNQLESKGVCVEIAGMDD
jgi:glycyl-radical enzyme activating protein